KLTSTLEPTSLLITNDSHLHRHHRSMKERAEAGEEVTETHFSVEVVSSKFEGQKTIQRHRMINNALKEEFDQGLHALVLKTRTPSEVDK
ncbi:bola-like protein, partial [Atractiella rhizophila]